MANRDVESLADPLYFGFGANRTKIEPDGTLAFEGDATVFDDLRVSPFSVPALGSNPPTPEIVSNDGTATTGTAGEFNGTTSVATTADYSALDTATLSLALWVKLNSVNSQELIDRDISSGFEFYVSGGDLTFSTGSGSVVTGGVVAGATQLLVVTATAEGANTRLRLYINGTFQQENVVNSNISVGAGGLRIGQWSSGWNADGILDDIQMYNVSLSDAQVLEMYNSGAGIVGLPTGVTEATELVARFQNDATNTATLGSGFDLTLTDVTLVTGLIGITTGSFGVALDAFSPDTVNDKFFTIQFMHGKKIGSTIFPHVHWYGEDLTIGDVVWKLEYVWNQAGLSIPNTTIVSRVVANDTTGDPLNSDKPVQRMNNLPTVGLVPPMVSESVSSTMICRLYRDASDPLDTYTGKAYLHEFDAHVELDMVGSRLANSK